MCIRDSNSSGLHCSDFRISNSQTAATVTHHWVEFVEAGDDCFNISNRFVHVFCKQFNVSFISVSYTHLDVYKRQVVTELPYMVNKARLLQSIANLVKDKRIEGISDLRDESDRDGMRMVVELKKEANPQVVLNQLYHYSQMQETVGIILLALADGQPKVMNIKEILDHYVAFQCDVIRRRTAFDLRKAQAVSYTHLDVYKRQR